MSYGNSNYIGRPTGGAVVDSPSVYFKATFAFDFEDFSGGSYLAEAPAEMKPVPANELWRLVGYQTEIDTPFLDVGELAVNFETGIGGKLVGYPSCSVSSVLAPADESGIPPAWNSVAEEEMQGLEISLKDVDSNDVAPIVGAGSMTFYFERLLLDAVV